MSLLLPKPAKRQPKARKRIKTRRPVKRQSPRPSAVARRKADRAWSLAVRERAGHVCEWCHAKATDAHHVFGKKAHPDLRHDVDNGVALCRLHHLEAHKWPMDFRLEFYSLRSDSWAALYGRRRLAPVEAA